jgi:hypothetical protein
MSLQDFYNWAETTWIGQMMQQNTYIFPSVEVVHIMTFTLMLGAVYTVNFRVLGFALKSRPVSEVIEGLSPWTKAGYISTFFTGWLLFMAESVKLSFNSAWHPKMMLLGGAIVVQLLMSQFFLRGRVETYPALAKITALASCLLWLATGFAARWIAFI